MKQTNRYGIILVVPEIESARQQMGMGLQSLLQKRKPEICELFSGAVFICLPAEVAMARFDLDDRPTRILLDPAGKVVEADGFDFIAAGNAGKFVESFRAWLHGSEDSRLLTHAKKIHDTLPQEAKDAIRSIESDDATARDNAVRLLQDRADTIMAFLIALSRDEKKVDRRDRLRSIIRSHFEGSSASSAGSRLPFGAVGDTGSFNFDDGCSFCGLGNVSTPSTRKFLRFLTK